MTDVTLTIGDRRHVLACRAGQEGQFARLGRLLDERWAAANRAAGGIGGERAMLFVALMLADALDEAERRPPPEPLPAPSNDDLLEQLADRLEALAASLEK